MPRLMPLYRSPHDPRWSDELQKSLLQPRRLRDLPREPQHFDDTFGRTQTGLLLIFPEVVHRFLTRVQADAADLLQVGAALVDLAGLMPSAVDDYELCDAAQVAAVLLHGAGINERHPTRLDLLQEPGRRVHPVPADLLGAAPQDIDHQPTGI